MKNENLAREIQALVLKEGGNISYDTCLLCVDWSESANYILTVNDDKVIRTDGDVIPEELTGDDVLSFTGIEFLEWWSSYWSEREDYATLTADILEAIKEISSLS